MSCLTPCVICDEVAAQVSSGVVIMNVIIRDKDEYHRQTTERMNTHFVIPDWTIRQKLALTCRILAAEGHDSGLAG